MSATVSAPPLRIEDIVRRLPVEWVGADVASLMAMAEIGGTVELRTVTVTRSLTGRSAMTIAGDVGLRQGRALVGSNRTPMRDVSASIVVDGDRARVTDVQGDYGPLHFTGGTIVLTDLATVAQWDAQATGEGQAAELISMAHDVGQARVATLLGSLQAVTGTLRAPSMPPAPSLQGLT